MTKSQTNVKLYQIDPNVESGQIPQKTKPKYGGEIKCGKVLLKYIMQFRKLYKLSKR